MLRYAMMAIALAFAIAVAFVLLPTVGVRRQEPRILATGDTVPANNGFVIHPAAPAAPDAPAPSANPGDLDAVMQRLRAGSPKPDAAATPTVVAQPATPPAAPPQTTQAVPVAPPPPPGMAPTDLGAPPPRWSSVTAQGTRWRMARAGNGYVLSIDMGGGQTADVHVQPAFGNLDTAAVNMRVDYLRDTIVQNFSRQSGSYTFARDGSVSVDR